MKHLMQNISSYFAVGLLLISGSCKEGSKTTSEGEMALTEAAPEIRVYALDGGTVQVNNLELFAQDETYKGQTAVFADAYYVIQHPKGTLMWDAGLPQSLVPMDEPFTDPSGNFTVSRRDSVQAQLAAIGMGPEDIDYLSLSHTHFDHSGHAESIGNAVWLVHADEYDFVTSLGVQQNQPEVYEAVNDLKNIRKFTGDHDVFGDGSVVIKAMPGHTPGHCALYVNLPDHGPLMLSGDLYHLELNRANKRVPIFNYDVKQTLKSMEDFEAFADSTGARVYLQHNTEDFNSMPKAPKYLK